MRIGVLGAGKVGCALAIGLKERGFKIVDVCSRSSSSVEFLASRLEQDFSNDLVQMVQGSDVVFITVSDNQIFNAALEISEKSRGKELQDKVFLHCSGALTSDSLQPLEKLGASIGSLHPIQSFAEKEEGWRGLEGCYFGYEGSSAALKLSGKIVQTLEGHLITIHKQDKPLYHAAACMISNYTVTLAYLATDLLNAAGIASDTGMKALLPLLKNTVSNVEQWGSIQALTGPIARGDSIVVKEHLTAMKQKIPGVMEAYMQLGKTTVEVALEKGTITKEQAMHLKKTLVIY